MDARPVAASLPAQLSGSHWHRARALAPRLREQVRVHVIRYRGQPWAVLEDRLNARYHRFDRRAWRVIRRLDGNAPLERIWHDLLAEGAEDAPSQQELLALLGQMHALDLLASDALPDLIEQARRERTQAKQRWRQRYLNPLSMRWRLLDPDRFLETLTRRLGPWLGGRGALLWLVWVLPAVLLASLHWRELSENFLERALAFDNLLLMWLIYPAMKLLHEIGHGIACKRRGGAVHEMGLMLLLFMPVPYVDASSAWIFPDKRDRMLVGAAGILVELALAAGAFYLWLWLEPGVAKATAYDAAVLASFSTVVFNANPLLRYDGYFVLADALEIPNLGQRAGRFWVWLFERAVLRRRDAASPVRATGEAAWFALYAPLSFVYRIFVTFSVALFVATRYLTVGIFIAMWSLAANLGVPLLRGAQWLRRQALGRPEAGLRWRFLATLAVALAPLAVPLPHRSQVDGVLWLPEQGVLRAAEAGFVTQVSAADGSQVQTDGAILTLDDPALRARASALAAREEAARARYEATRLTDPVRAEPLRSALEREIAQRVDAQRRLAAFEVRARAAGRLWLQDGDELLGRHVRQGQVLGYVIPPHAPLVRVIVDQADAEYIRSDTRALELRLSAAPSLGWAARIVRAVPSASNELPSAALGRQGGGDAPIDPRDGSGRHALLSHFEYELALPEEFPYRFIGSRVSVRFDHAPQPLAQRIWNALRLLFLSEFKS